MSLLQKAKEITSKSKLKITPEHVELAKAFINNEVGITAVNMALGHPKTSLQGYITICRALRHDYTVENLHK
jgi:hypothetical protein